MHYDCDLFHTVPILAPSGGIIPVLGIGNSRAFAIAFVTSREENYVPETGSREYDQMSMPDLQDERQRLADDLAGIDTPADPFERWVVLELRKLDTTSSIVRELLCVEEELRKKRQLEQ